MPDLPPDAPILQSGLAALQKQLDAIPEGKRGALVIGYERSSTLLPRLQIGIATRINGNWSIGADTTLQQKAKPTTRFYTAVTWLFLLCVMPLSAQSDGMHRVSLAQVATTSHTNVCTVGPVVYVRKQDDGDIHITLDDGRSRVVVEIIPQLPLPIPKKGQRIEVCGITRYDKKHQWPEIHPVTQWAAIK